MICTQCQSENSFAAIFCDTCGVRLETACPKCGEPNRQGAKFCRNCGQTIDQPQRTVSGSVQRSPSPDTYVPPHLVEKILSSRHALEGERKQVTVLFADIRSSTKLIEELDPEEAQKLIDPVLRVMMDAVHRYEGTVNQVLGDGIMALFGAPLAHEDHALRACYAALAMQEEMRRHRRKLGQSEELGLQIGIGLNSGEVVVRSISNDLNVDYSALGHTTHLAARMEELAGAGAVLMTAATLREVEGFVEVKSLGTVQAKGVSRPVDAYELLGATSARKRLHAAVSRGLTPFVGRKTEIEIFQRLIEQTAAGRGQVLSMVGEAGMGKSRLVHEFVHYHVPSGWLVLEGTSVSYGKATVYFPIIELLRRYFAISEAEETESIQAKVIDYVLKLDEMLKDAIPPILALLNALPDHKEDSLAGKGSNGRRQEVIDATTRFNSMEPQQRRRNTFDVLKRVFMRESQKNSLILVFEDLHWIDSETQAFLDSLVESLPMARILLLVDYRPGYSQTWSEKTYYTQIRVDPLPSTGADELLQHLMGNNEDLAPLKELLIKRTEGNPFFVEESVRSLAETGILIGEKGGYRPGLKIDNIRIPSTVQTVLTDRVDRLPLEEKHLLQTAAVIGVIVPLPLLRSVSELPDDELYRYLARLQAAEFLYETNLYPELEYTFKHALTNEVVYGALLQERRISLHGRIVGALEGSADNNLQDHIEEFAHHAFRGELWDKAVVYSNQAAARAVSRSGFRNAVFCFEQALEALRHLPENPDTLRHAVDFRFEIRNALFMLGDFEQGLNYLEQARATAVALNDRSRLGMLFNFMTAHSQIQGNSEQAIGYANQALNHTNAPEHIDLHIVAHYFLGVAYHNVGQYDQAIGVLERALFLIGDRKYERFGTPVIVSVVCRAWLVRCFAQIGKFGEAVAYGDQAIQIGVESNHPYSVIYAYYGVGVLFLTKGDFDRAIAELERGLEISEAADIPVHQPLIASCLGSAYAFAGRLDEALRLLDRAVGHTAWMRRKGGLALRMAGVSEAYMLAGRTEAAEALARDGLKVSHETNDKGSRAWLLRILGDLTSWHSSFKAEEAEANYAESLGLAEELGMRPLQAHCHLGLGHVHAQAKELEKARFELLAAVELYRAMSMPFWLSKAEAALATVM
jgi:class 3 adenylate cyclase/tetratricopeptide (TPR) repeat protein